jgi:hypothetical protein
MEQLFKLLEIRKSKISSFMKMSIKYKNDNHAKRS